MSGDKSHVCIAGVTLHGHVRECGWGASEEQRSRCGGYRCTLLIRQDPSVGPYSRPMPRGPYGGPMGWAFSYERGTPAQDYLAHNPPPPLGLS